MSKHTPGPWQVVKPGHGSPTEYLCVQLGSDEMYSTLEMLPADAHLISAAPELLEACKVALTELEAMGDPCPSVANYRLTVKLLRKVVAKAEGGAA